MIHWHDSDRYQSDKAASIISRTIVNLAGFQKRRCSEKDMQRRPRYVVSLFPRNRGRFRIQGRKWILLESSGCIILISRSSSSSRAITPPWLERGSSLSASGVYAIRFHPRSRLKWCKLLFGSSRFFEHTAAESTSHSVAIATVVGAKQGNNGMIMSSNRSPISRGFPRSSWSFTADRKVITFPYHCYSRITETIARINSLHF